MKKVFLTILCCVSILTTVTSCKKAKLKGIEITNIEEVVLKGTELKGLKLTTIFDDDTKGDLLDVTSEMITGYDKNKTGEQEITVKYEDQSYQYHIYVADKIVSSAKELREALKNQKDGEHIALKSGTYDLDRDNEVSYQDQTGYYFLVTANNVTFKGFGSAIITSSVESENGALASQNLVTVAGNNTTFDELTFACKNEPNKVIEIIGKDTTIKNVKIEPRKGSKFAGSIYLSTNSGNTVIDNVTLKYGRISTTGGAGSTLELKNVTIDFAGAELDGENLEKTFWAFDNSRSKIKVSVTKSKIVVSKTFKETEDYKTFSAQLPNGFNVEEVK